MDIKEEDRTKCEVYSRVMGYIRPKNSYNKGKEQEAKDRTYFNVDQSSVECSCENCNCKNN